MHRSFSPYFFVLSIVFQLTFGFRPDLIIYSHPSRFLLQDDKSTPHIATLQSNLADSDLDTVTTVAGGFFDGVVILGHYAFTSGDKFSVFDITDPTHPIKMASEAIQGTIQAISGRYAYLTQRRTYLDEVKVPGGLRIVDISNPSKPIGVGFFETATSAYGVAVRGDYAYVVGEDFGLRILNVSDPAKIVETGFYETPEAARDVDLGTPSGAEGQLYAFVANYSGGLRILNVSNPDQPVEVTSILPNYESSATWKVKVAGDKVYTAEESAGIFEFLVSDPANPIRGNIFKNANYIGTAQSLEFSNGYIFQASYDKGLVMITDAFAWQGQYQKAPDIYDVAISGRYVYLAAGDSGFIVAWFGPRFWTKILAGGGTASAALDKTTIQVPAGCLPENAWLNFISRYSGALSDTGKLIGLGHFYELQGTKQNVPIEPSCAYSVTVEYNQDELRWIDEISLALYHWDGSQWVKEESSQVDLGLNRLVAQSTQLGIWGVLGEEIQHPKIYLPFLSR